jgi:hypothetical protein
MDDHVVARGDRALVRNGYVVYLCPEDYRNLGPRAAQITADLRNKLAKHAQEMGYVAQGDLHVEMVLDPDLELGYFGILAQRAYPQQPAAEAGSQPGPAGVRPEPVPGAVIPGAPPVVRQAPAEAAHAAAPSVSLGAAAAAADVQIPPSTEVLPPKQAEELGLAGRSIVITWGDEVRQFAQSRVVLGRSREADFRIDDPNVSRKHAAVYWNNGRLMLDDLGSTNGTMVNGYPVTTTMLRPGDTVAIGDSRLTVEGG